MEKRKLISRNEIILISIVLILAIFVYVFFSVSRINDANAQAEVIMDGKTILTVSLKEDTEIYLEEHPAIRFIINDGRIAFYKSDCPDQLCIRKGFLHLPGQSAICLPNRVILTIVSPGSNEDGVDIFIN